MVHGLETIEALNEKAAMRELPRYKSHKLVWALKIHAIDLDLPSGNAVITPEDQGYGPFPVDAEYMSKHKPRIGGYYVVYEGGYKSWSPADAFENGYVKLEGDYSPLTELKAALQANEDYAWSWFCNVACVGLDCGGSHSSANHYAAQFMRNAFDVDVRTQDNWKAFEARWKQERNIAWSAECDTVLTKLQSVIDSPQKRTHAEMQALAERLSAISAAVAAMELAEYEP